jgi:hypothetical protein
MDTKRWLVTLIYRTELDPAEVVVGVDELDEIADLVERGPDWNALIEVRARLHEDWITTPGLTVNPDHLVVVVTPPAKARLRLVTDNGVDQ